MATLEMFNRDVVVSIRPNYAKKIMDGQKTVELRRRFPETTSTGSLALIYSTSPVRAIVGYATIEDVKYLPLSQIWQHYSQQACIEKPDFDDYFAGLAKGYAIILSQVKVLKKQIPAATLLEQFDFVPPQSFRYIGDDHTALLKHGQFQVPHRQQRRNRA